MPYNQTSNELKQVIDFSTFKVYMKIQIRYIKFYSKILKINPENFVQKFGHKYSELYTKKHEIYINS